MKTIGILGCGWLGMPLAKQLVTQGYTVKGTTTSEDKLLELAQYGIQPHLLQVNNWNVEIGNSFLNSIDILIITIPPIRNEENPTYKAIFEKLLYYIQQYPIKHIIYTSSVSVYAPSKEIITENSTRYSIESTAKQIRAVEELLLQNLTFTTCILRLGGLFGGEREPVRYICKKDVLDNPELPINMVHLDDIIQYINAILSSMNLISGIYNLVSPLYKNRFDYYNQRSKLYNLVLPEEGTNNWLLHKKVSGEAIQRLTGLEYRY
ncbi:MAG: epimerase [Flavobacteriaceae bacterium]|jgi:nucleoside-diphosphate-sugar epimerase|nr:epimerase [Flavobacteriaceae bacterium]